MGHAFLHSIYDMALDMAPWLLIGFVIAFACSYFLNEATMRRHLGGAGWLPIIKASLFGLPLPLCSCGVLPVALALRRSGARKSAVCAFLASTPQSGSDALPLAWSMLGPVMTALRFVGAILSGLLSGALVRWFGKAQPPSHEPLNLEAECAALCGCHHHDAHHPHEHNEPHHHEYASRKERLLDAARFAFIHLPGELAPLLLIGLLIASAMETLLPEGILNGLPLVYAYVLAVLIGIPTYACSVAIIPIAVGLIATGLTPGTAFIFLACAPTTHIGALLVISRHLGWRAALAFVCGVILCAVSIALCIDLLLAAHLHLPALTHTTAHHHHATLPLLMLLVLSVLSVYAVFQKCVKGALTQKSQD